MQVAGPYDILGAIRRTLPKTLPVLAGEIVSLDWYLDELPVTAPNAKGEPRANPHGIFRILSPVAIRDAVSADAVNPYRLQLTSQTDSLTFVTGTLSYFVTERDVAAVQSVTGIRSGVGGHVFVAGTDYTFTVDSIVWTGAGALPDNGTAYSVVYQHRMYYPRRIMPSRYTIRAILKCQQKTMAREYPMSVLAAVLGNSLEMKLRSMAGNRMVAPATTDVPYTETVTLGRVLACGPLPMDATGSLASWFVDFTLNVGAVFEDSPVQAILNTPYDIVFTT